MDDAATQAALDALVVALRRATERSVGDAAEQVQTKARALAPHETGELAASIVVDGPTPIGADAWEAKVGPTTVYGRQRELGGEIHQKSASLLVWPNRLGFAQGRSGVTRAGASWFVYGAYVFAKAVYQDPEPYLKPAFEATDIRGVFVKNVAEAIASV